MINIKAFIDSASYDKTYQENKERHKKAQEAKADTSTPQKHQDAVKKEQERHSAHAGIPKKNETIIKIDKYYFTVNQNVESLDLSLHLAINKIPTLRSNIYQVIGANEQRISFNAVFVGDDILSFDGFVKLAQKRAPLNFSMLDLTTPAKILIDKLSSKKSKFALDANRQLTYQKLDVSISGILL